MLLVKYNDSGRVQTENVSSLYSDYAIYNSRIVPLNYNGPKRLLINFVTGTGYENYNNILQRVFQNSGYLLIITYFPSNLQTSQFEMNITESKSFFKFNFNYKYFNFNI